MQCRGVAVPWDIAAAGVHLEVADALCGDGAQTQGQDFGDSAYVRYLPFEGEAPTRRVVLAWRRSFTRYEAIAALRNAIYGCELPGVKRLS